MIYNTIPAGKFQYPRFHVSRARKTLPPATIIHLALFWIPLLAVQY